MKPIYLYNEKFYWQPRLKNFFKVLLGRQWRGPQAVEYSLVSGLKQLGQPFILNQVPNNLDRIGVLSGAMTLRQALKWKQQGLVKKIIAGPNLVVGPYDYQKIILNPLIDIFLVPSQWSLDFYASLAPSLTPKLRVWPAGVMLPPPSNREKTIDFLIFNKVSQPQLLSGVTEVLKHGGYSWKILHYGKFKQDEYFFALEQSESLIYLSESESQGLAMFEAWARGVPALVWERGFWNYKEYSWQGQTASPYVTSENGMVFKDLLDFPGRLMEFRQAAFHPREFIEREFTWQKSAEKYLKIYNEA